MAENTDKESNKSQSLTLNDIGNMIQRCASKDDIDDIRSHIRNFKVDTDAKVEKVSQRTEFATELASRNADLIDGLQASIEMLKQEQLKHNICVSGVPPTLVENSNTNELMTNIASKLGMRLNASQFSLHPIAQNKFIIVRFYNMTHKIQLLGKIRAKKSLMVEEVFAEMSSNSQIYLNDHLTTYFSKLYQTARNAKKEGKLASATSYGGKVRARKHLTDPPTIIASENQLLALIHQDDADDFESISHTDEMMNASHSTSQHTDNTPTQKPSQKPKIVKAGASRDNKKHSYTGHPSKTSGTNNKLAQKENVQKRNTQKSNAQKNTTTQRRTLKRRGSGSAERPYKILRDNNTSAEPSE